MMRIVTNVALLRPILSCYLTEKKCSNNPIRHTVGWSLNHSGIRRILWSDCITSSCGEGLSRFKFSDERYESFCCLKRYSNQRATGKRDLGNKPTIEPGHAWIPWKWDVHNSCHTRYFAWQLEHEMTMKVTVLKCKFLQASWLNKLCTRILWR